MLWLYPKHGGEPEALDWRQSFPSKKDVTFNRAASMREWVVIGLGVIKRNDLISRLSADYSL